VHLFLLDIPRDLEPIVNQVRHLDVIFPSGYFKASIDNKLAECIFLAAPRLRSIALQAGVDVFDGHLTRELVLCANLTALCIKFVTPFSWGGSTLSAELLRTHLTRLVNVRTLELDLTAVCYSWDGQVHCELPHLRSFTLHHGCSEQLVKIQRSIRTPLLTHLSTPFIHHPYYWDGTDHDTNALAEFVAVAAGTIECIELKGCHLPLDVILQRPLPRLREIHIDERCPTCSEPDTAPPAADWPENGWPAIVPATVDCVSIKAEHSELIMVVVQWLALAPWVANNRPSNRLRLDIRTSEYGCRLKWATLAIPLRDRLTRHGVRSRWFIVDAWRGCTQALRAQNVACYDCEHQAYQASFHDV
jgi:hypothetical protein